MLNSIHIIHCAVLTQIGTSGSVLPAYLLLSVYRLSNYLRLVQETKFSLTAIPFIVVSLHAHTTILVQRTPLHVC